MIKMCTIIIYVLLNTMIEIS